MKIHHKLIKLTQNNLRQRQNALSKTPRTGDGDSAAVDTPAFTKATATNRIWILYILIIFLLGFFVGYTLK